MNEITIKLINALEDLLGDTEVDIGDSGYCVTCGRLIYQPNEVEDPDDEFTGQCTADDCPRFIARTILKDAKITKHDKGETDGD